MKYAVKYLKNTFYPLNVPDNIKVEEGQLVIVRTEKGEEASQDRIKEFQDDYQKLYTEIMAGENMQNYSAAASEMEKMAQYISGMIGLFFDGQDAQTCELPAQDACTHNCSTCGGCH